MLSLVILFALLLAAWLILSGIFSQAFILLGIFSCLVSVVFYRLAYKSDSSSTKRIENRVGFLLGMVGYCAWLIKEIAKSSLDVSLKMWQLEPHISPQTSWIPINISNETHMAIFANSITLTPGTVTIGTREGMLHVHSLTEDAMEELKEGEMLRRVNKLVVRDK